VVCERRVGGGGTGILRTSLGNVSPAEAARYLVELAHTTAEVGDAAIGGAFADVDLAQLPPRSDEDAPLGSRRQALLWLGQGDYPTEDLVKLYGDLKPRAFRLSHFSCKRRWAIEADRRRATIPITRFGARDVLARADKDQRR
jgi:hypothetical protein